MSEFNFKQYLKEGRLLKEEDLKLSKSVVKENNQPYDEVERRKEAEDLADAYSFFGDEKEKYVEELIKATEKKPSSESPWDDFQDVASEIAKKYIQANVDSSSVVKEDKKYTRAEIEQAERDYFSGRMSKEEFNEIVFGDERKLNDISDDLEEGRYGPGRGMDDEYDEPRGRRSSYKDALMNPPTPSGNQEEEEFEDIEDIEIVSRGKDYDAQNQKVLRSMRESKFEKALKNASKKLTEGKKKRRKK